MQTSGERQAFPIHPHNLVKTYPPRESSKRNSLGKNYLRHGYLEASVQTGQISLKTETSTRGRTTTTEKRIVSASEDSDNLICPVLSVQLRNQSG